MDNIWICKACVKRMTGLDRAEQFAIGGDRLMCERCGEGTLRRDQVYYLPSDWQRHVPRWRELQARMDAKETAAARRGMSDGGG